MGPGREDPKRGPGMKDPTGGGPGKDDSRVDPIGAFVGLPVGSKPPMALFEVSLDIVASDSPGEAASGMGITVVVVGSSAASRLIALATQAPGAVFVQGKVVMAEL